MLRIFNSCLCLFQYDKILFLIFDVFLSFLVLKSINFSILGGKLDDSPVPVDGFDVWDTISNGKPSPRTEILLNIDLAPDEEFYNEVQSELSPYQGAAIRVGDMKLLISCPNSTWFKPPELGKMSATDTVSAIILVSVQ